MKKELSIYDDGIYSYNSEEEPCKIVKEFLKELLGVEFVVKLRVVDPRLRPFDCYGKITKEMKEKLKELYSSYKETDKGISFSPGSHVFINIYNVKGLKSKISIRKDEKKYKKELDDSKGVMF